MAVWDSIDTRRNILQTFLLIVQFGSKAIFDAIFDALYFSHVSQKEKCDT